MAFNFNWSPLTADASFYERARDLLTTALNKSPKPPIIVDDIFVTEFNLGSVPPDLEILEIGDIAEDRFRGIFKMCYSGDAFLTLKTRVQVRLRLYLLVRCLSVASPRHAVIATFTPFLRQLLGIVETGTYGKPELFFHQVLGLVQPFLPLLPAQHEKDLGVLISSHHWQAPFCGVVPILSFPGPWPAECGRWQNFQAHSPFALLHILRRQGYAFRLDKTAFVRHSKSNNARS